VTKACHRQCAGCCNTYTTIMKHASYIERIADLPTELDEIMITGGEPMLVPERTQRLSTQIRNRYPASKLYLYSAEYNEAMKNTIPIVDGLHYTVHEGATLQDITSLNRLQELLQSHKAQWREKSFRLYIDNRVILPVTINPDIWSQVNISKWFTEQELLDKQPTGLPVGESLFIYIGT